jgi:Domain of unknown function (DUF4410)
MRADDVGCLVRGNEHDGICNFFGSADALVRNLCVEEICFVFLGLRKVVEHSRFHRTWANDVDPNACAGEFESRRFRDAFYSVLAADIHRRGRPTDFAVRRRDVNDAAFALPKHSPNLVLHAQKHTKHIGVEDQVKSATGMQSSQVVDLMASSLVSDLNRGGVKAQRLGAGQPLPKNGWLVHGVFTEVDQGSRVLRAEVGFGAGSTDLAVLVHVADLQKGKPESFYKLEAQAGSRKLPGAVVTRNPYVAAAKFVMSRRDLPKNIRQTAQTVADQIVRRARAK